MPSKNFYSNVRPRNIANGLPINPKGQSNTVNLQSAFSTSPIHSGVLTVAERELTFQDLVLDGLPKNIDGSTSLGNGFQTDVSRDYIDHPNIPDIPNIALDAAGDKLPSPYMPNPNSPGEGFDPSQAEFEGEVKDPTTLTNKQFGSGQNGLVNPAVTSERFSKLTLGDYVLGKSAGTV